MLKNNSNTFKVERMGSLGTDASWYEIMLSPFKTFEECIQYIEQYRHKYPIEHQNYKITFQP